MRCVWDLKRILMQCLHLLIATIYALISLTKQQRDQNLPYIHERLIELDSIGYDTM